MRPDKAHGTVLVKDPRVLVTRFDFEPGQETGWHVHEHDYIICPVTVCRMGLIEPDGRTHTVWLGPGEAYRRDAGVEHNVINEGDGPMSFVEVELL